MTASNEPDEGEEAAAGFGGAAPDGLQNACLYAVLAFSLFSLPICAAGLGGLNDEYVPPPPVKPRPQVVERVVEKPVKDPAAERRAQAAEAEIARLKAELDKANRLTDPASACLKNGAWQAACGFAAYAGGPVFRVVGGDLRFMMGTAKGADSMADDYEGPQRQVSFRRRFALAETEVTVAQYLVCVKDGGCKEPEWREAGSEEHYQTGGNAYYRDINVDQPDSPITGVSLHDARAYVAWLSRKTRQVYTLPTEAQWEYAARGGRTGRWYFGDDESQLRDHAWYDANSGDKLHPVGSTRLNTHPWGLKDMAGNASEWVEDCRHDNYTNSPANGDKAWEGANDGDCSWHVVRGGSWREGAWGSRAASRLWVSTDRRDWLPFSERGNSVSFRPIRMLP